MGCCGKNRQSAATTAFDTQPIGSATAVRRPALRPLEYTGPTSLTALGPATGRLYRFAATGSRLAVAPRDWEALARLPTLRPAALRE